MKPISEHISYLEAIKGGIPNATQLEAMENVAAKLFEPIRKWYGKPIAINSFYRSVEYNAKIKGAKNSQHCTGEAIDIDAGTDNYLIWNWLRSSKLVYDQIINEKPICGNPSWIHISLKLVGTNRNQKLMFNGKNYIGV